MRPEGHQVAHAHADLTLAVIPSGMEVGSMARNAQTYEVPLGTSAPGQPPETLIHHPERKNTTAARICRIEVSRNLYQATPDEIQTSDNQGETVKNCPVCLDELKSGAGAITACGHIFHAGCCRSSEMVALERDFAWPCPTCRGPVTSLRITVLDRQNDSSYISKALLDSADVEFQEHRAQAISQLKEIASDLEVATHIRTLLQNEGARYTLGFRQADGGGGAGGTASDQQRYFPEADTQSAEGRELMSPGGSEFKVVKEGRPAMISGEFALHQESRSHGIGVLDAHSPEFLRKRFRRRMLMITFIVLIKAAIVAVFVSGVRGNAPYKKS